MSDPFVRAQGRGCLAQLGALAGAVALVALGLAVSVGAATLGPSEGPARLALFAGVFFAVMILVVAGALSFAAKRARVLDPGFARVGVPGRSFLLNLREYHGTYQGRPVDALYARRGPLLELSVGARVQGALAVGTRSSAGEALRGLLGMTTIQLHDPAFSQLVVSSVDPAWAASVLAVPEVRDTVLRALHDPTGRELRVVAVRPGAVKLTRRWFVPDAAVDEVAPTVDSLARFAAVVERLPPPARPVPLSELKRLARTSPGALGAKVALVLLGVLVTIALAVGAIAFKFVSSSRAPGASQGPALESPEAPTVLPRARRRWR